MHLPSTHQSHALTHVSCIHPQITRSHTCILHPPTNHTLSHMYLPSTHQLHALTHVSSIHPPITRSHTCILHPPTNHTLSHMYPPSTYQSHALTPAETMSHICTITYPHLSNKSPTHELPTKRAHTQPWRTHARTITYKSAQTSIYTISTAKYYTVIPSGVITNTCQEKYGQIVVERDYTQTGAIHDT